MTNEELLEEFNFIINKIYEIAGAIGERPVDASFMAGCLYSEVRKTAMKIRSEINANKEDSK